MKIAVPLRQLKFSEHFGGADAFALYQVDETNRSVGPRHVMVPPEHGRGVYPAWLRWQGATMVLAGNMGPRASGLLAREGIAVTLGAEGEDPDELVRRFLNGELHATGEPCRQPGFHECGHDDHRGHGCGDHHDERQH